MTVSAASSLQPPPPLPEAEKLIASIEKLIASIRDKGARLAIPSIVDLSELVAENDGVSRIVLKSTQELLLKVALQRLPAMITKYDVKDSGREFNSPKLRASTQAERPTS